MSEERKDERPDPDALLREVSREEHLRGKLKVFLGYAPGVGKTYAMLKEAHTLRSRGEDVIVGLVETHGRPETDSLLQGLEVFPRRQVLYKTILLTEFDLDGILARKPKAVLVDELAHTNPPGFRHAKRYQDVQDLLHNGIDVYTTVNIQHFESLNDTIEQITGIRVQETIPDTVLDDADEVQIIDIPLEELFERLREGKVYIPEQAQKAMQNFFQRGNLVALREISLFRVARKMDSELLSYMRAKAVSRVWPAAEKVLACIGANAYAKQLIRTAYQLATESKAEFLVVTVTVPGIKGLSQKEKLFLSEALNLAGELGAKISSLSGTNVAEEIVRFARQNNVTRIVLGKPLSYHPLKFWRKSPVSDMLRIHNGFSLHLVTPLSDEKAVAARRPPSSAKTDLRKYLISSAMVAGITLVNLFLQKFINPRSLDVLYIIAVLGSGLAFGTRISLYTSVVSVLVYDFFFTEPHFSLTMHRVDDIVNIVIFFMISIVLGQLIKINKKQYAALTFRQERSKLIEEMGKELLSLPVVEQFLSGVGPSSKDRDYTYHLIRVDLLDEIAQVMVRHLAKIFEAPTFVLFPSADGEIRVWARGVPESVLTNEELGAARWVLQNGEPAGLGTQTLYGIKTYLEPMKTDKATLGVVGIQMNVSSMMPEQRQLLGAVINLASLSVARLGSA
jgi:two-component system sensor histidine kinase KdpD